jgi:hypothetical protein
MLVSLLRVASVALLVVAIFATMATPQFALIIWALVFWITMLNEAVIRLLQRAGQ